MSKACHTRPITLGPHPQHRRPSRLPLLRRSVGSGGATLRLPGHAALAGRVLRGNLGLGLLVAVGDEAVEETTRAAFGVVFTLGLLNLAVQVAGSFFVNFFVVRVLVDVG